MSASDVTLYRFGPFRLDPRERLLYSHDQPVPLTPKAVETLRVLVERHGRLVTKDDILREVWPDVVVEENNLAQHISMLRRTLAQTGGDGPFIETVPKRGYRFVAPVTEGRGPASVATPAAADSADVVRLPEPPAAGDTRRSSRSWWVMAASALIVLALTGIAWYSRPAGADSVILEDRSAGTPRRLAVLPFVNLGPAESAYLADGTVEELTSRLAGLEGLGVISTTSTREYDRSGKTVRRIGADLGAAYIIEGSVRGGGTADAMVRIIPRMIRVADDVTVWTQHYEVKLSEVEGAHADMARRIGQALQVDAVAESSRRSRPDADSEAYLAYLRGMSAFQQSQSDTSLQALARRELELAVTRDPKFSLAWSWLARVYAAQHASGAMRTPDVHDAAARAARTAIALAPDLPEARLALARVLMDDRDSEGALRELELARSARLTLEGIRIEAWLRQQRGEWSQSLALFMRGFELDPAAISDLIGVHYLHLRDYPQSARFLAIARAANRSAAVVPEAWLQFSDGGNIAAARDVLEPALALKSPDARVRGLLARYEWFDGRHERALALIREMDSAGAWLPANFRFPASIAMGQVYESMGQRDRARECFADGLKRLETALTERPDDYQLHAGIGLAAAGLQRSELAVRHGRRAVELLPVTKDAAAGPVYVYLLASIYARLDRRAEAFATLDQMFAAPSFYSDRWIERDPWFASLRADPAFSAHLERWRRQKGSALRP
jgi:DNA-binding winged helix-turn-helix (wHTH) protein/TolB-like protein/cytochrome c-type biogenesis protein CcmH/NrfG